MEFTFRNVNDAFLGLVEGIHTNDILTIVEDSRNGKVWRIPEPVTICYQRPWERVLFNQARDCNPFFHVYEALWMLAGRNDVKSVAYYASNMKNYSDDGETLNGAYGYRWRTAQISDELEGKPTRLSWDKQHGGIDQFKILADHLRNDPTSRRAVLQMWNVEDDLLKIGFPVNNSRDVCCNLSVMFFVNSGYLDMTVTNRSNDMIWGTLGANVVHFSFLQEYTAAKIGVPVGRYYQFSNNLHVYESNWKPKKWLVEYKNRTAFSFPVDYTDSVRKLVPLVADPERFDREVQEFVGTGGELNGYEEPFLANVAQPMCQAFDFHKGRRYEEALEQCERITADDWRTVATNWIIKRRDNYDAKQEKSVREGVSSDTQDLSGT